MNKLVKMVMAGLTVGVATMAAAAEVDYSDLTTSGSHSVGKTQKLIMPEDGIVYLTLSGIKAGKDCTFVAVGSNAYVAVGYTYVYVDEDTNDRYIFDGGELASGIDDVRTDCQNRCIVDKYSWIDASIVQDPEYEYEPGEWDECKTTPKSFYLCVSGNAGETITLTSMNGEVKELAEVGELSFAKTAVSAKKTAGSVMLTVNRSAAKGKVRVKYGTKFGTAKPGVDYVAKNGVLTWADGDKTAKTITIRLIPELFAEEAISRSFTVELRAFDESELGADEYPAALATDKEVVTVTVTEAKGKAEKTVKLATTKTESVPLETGTYQGVISAVDGKLANGFPELGSVTFTAKDAAKKALSAKVTVAGKTYAFAADTWNETSETTAVAELTSTTKVGKETYENTLRIEVVRGKTEASGAWKDSLAKVVLAMNIPTADGKGVQKDITYEGELYRDNAKIQGYLDAVLSGVGYYTIALAPTNAVPAQGVPTGNGYLTLTIDNKGKAKIAGLLADGSTKPSYSSIVAVKDEGDTLLVPVFVAKSPYCFGGTLKLFRGADGRFVVDSSEFLIWNNDNAALTYAGETGWSIELDPVGGYFNTVNSLQSYYLTHELSVSTVDVNKLLGDGLPTDYWYIDAKEAQPNGVKVSLAGNTLSTDKRSLVKDGKKVDFSASVNPCNVQVKLVRATGIVTGSFSVWTENAVSHKEISGLKHNGILLLSRDKTSSLGPEVMTAGFFNQTATLTYYNEKGQKKTRKYTASNPFNILAVTSGEPDWYADDWGDPKGDQAND